MTTAQTDTSPSHWLELVAELSSTFNLTSRDIAAVLEPLLGKLALQLDVNAVAVWTLEPGSNFMRIEASAGLNEGYIRYFNKTDRIRAGKAFVGRVMQGRQTLFTTNIAEEPLLDVERWRKILIEEGILAILAAPMFIGEKIVGAFEVYYTKEISDIDPQARQFLEIVANQVAITIENIRNYDTIENASKKLSDQVDKLLGLQRLTSSLGLSFYKSKQESLETFANYVMNRFGASGMSIFQVDEKTGLLPFTASFGISENHLDFLKKHPMPVGAGSLIGLAFQDKLIKTSPKVFVDARVNKLGRILLSIEGKTALAAYPLMVQDKSIGVIAVYYDDEHQFGDEELRISQMLSSYIAVSLLNLQIFGDLTIEHNKTVAMINSLDDGVIVYDLEDRIVTFNPRAEALLGVMMKDVVDKPRAKLAGEFANVLMISSIPLQDFEKKEVVMDKPTRLYLRVTFLPLRDEENRKIGSMRVIQDTTPEKELEQLKYHFITVAAHQLRTPLGMINWNLEMLHDGFQGALPPKAITTVERISKTNQRMIDLVGDLLTASRIEEGYLKTNSEEVDILEVVQSVIKEFEAERSAVGVTINTEALDGTDYKTMIDPTQFRAVIQNLLSNAIKYNHQDGTVRVKIEKKPTEYILSFTDTGLGIPVKDQGKVFSKFFRADNAIRDNTEGNGLGLFVVKSYVEAWKGKVWFISAEGKGTTFHIQIPIVKNVKPHSKPVAALV